MKPQIFVLSSLLIPTIATLAKDQITEMKIIMNVSTKEWPKINRRPTKGIAATIRVDNDGVNELLQNMPKSKDVIFLSRIICIALIPSERTGRMATFM